MIFAQARCFHSRVFHFFSKLFEIFPCLTNMETMHDARSMLKGNFSHRRRSRIRIRRPRKPETTSASSVAPPFQSPCEEGWINVFQNIAGNYYEFFTHNRSRAYRHRRRSLIRRVGPRQFTRWSPPLSDDDRDASCANSSRESSPLVPELADF